MIQHVKRNWLVSSKLTWGIRRILPWVLGNLKNLHFNGLPLNKVFSAWVKKVQRSYVWWHWISMQNLKENWHVLSKMTQWIWKFSTEHSKVSKLGLWWDSFIQSRKRMSLKFVKTLFYVGNKWKAQLTKPFTLVSE